MHDKKAMSIDENIENPPIVTDLDYTTDNESVKAPRRNSDAEPTKISSNQLIVKSPQDNLSVSVKSCQKEVVSSKRSFACDSAVFWLGLSQIFFGILMMGFGLYAILHEAAMSMVRLIYFRSFSSSVFINVLL